MIGRLVQAADFQRLLATPPRGRSAHFLLHHLAVEPSRPRRRAPGHGLDMRPGTGSDSADPFQQLPSEAVDTKLSTGDERKLSAPVDKIPSGCWLGCVAPKRHARRAVTRNMLKRQMRAAAELVEATLPQGLWLVRLRQGYPVAQFPSADSAALRTAARDELDRLFRCQVCIF